MLKERMNFLSSKKNINNKELVQGLITSTHYANILAGRYSLPHDIADALAIRLDININYIIECDKQDEETIKIANQLVEQAIFIDNTEEFAETLSNNHNELVIELTSKLLQGAIYLMYYNFDSYNKLFEDYLSYYLSYYETMSVPEPVTKAWLWYQIAVARNNEDFINAKNALNQLQEFSYEQKNTWVHFAQIDVEFYIYSRKFLDAESTLKQVIGRCYYTLIYGPLSHFYMLYSGIYTRRKQWNAALNYLDRSESKLEYAGEHALDLIPIINNNRIVIKTKLGNFKDALSDIDDYKNRFNSESEIPYPQIYNYKCEIFYQQSDYPGLIECLKEFEQCNPGIEYQPNIHFYKSQCALIIHNYENFVEHANICCLAFEQDSNYDRLTILYEQFILLAKKNRQYKLASEYYEKLTSILKLQTIY